MAIITKPTISKGQANEFDLSKSDLAAVSKVVNDSYFSDQTNWSKVILEYKSAEGNQHEMVIFDASEASPKGNFEVSEKAKDSFEVQSVKIMDFDGGYLKLQRGDLTVEDFDIAFGITSSTPSIAFDPIYTESNVTLSNSNRTATLSSTNAGIAKSEVWTTVKDVTGPSYIEYTVEDVSSPFFLGLVSSGAAFDGADLTSLDRLGASRVAISVKSDGGIYIGSSGTRFASVSSLNAGDIVTLAYDGPDAYVAVNGVWKDGFLPESTGGINIGTKSLINAGIEFEQNGNGVVGTSVSINQTPSIVLPSYTYIGS